MTIEWQTPEPRSGLLGLADRFIGPGATPAELWVQSVAPVAAAVAAPLYGLAIAPSWGVAQAVLAAVFALDLAGGVLTNATSAAKRWYHRPGQGFGAHLGFVLLHLVHLGVVAGVYLAGDIWWVALTGGYLVSAAVLILGVPQYLQRPVAYGTYAGAILLSLYAAATPAGLEWFLPVFYLKLLVSHLPKEEPYRPE